MIDTCRNQRKECWRNWIGTNGGLYAPSAISSANFCTSHFLHYNALPQPVVFAKVFFSFLHNLYCIFLTCSFVSAGLFTFFTTTHMVQYLWPNKQHICTFLFFYTSTSFYFVLLLHVGSIKSLVFIQLIDLFLYSFLFGSNYYITVGCYIKRFKLPFFILLTI